jgi:type I restriction enzyme, S subunit
VKPTGRFSFSLIPRAAKVYDRTITAADEAVTDVALSECHLPRVKVGSLVIAITGQGKTLGNCALLGIEATVNQHLAYVSLNPAEVAGSYVRGYLETRYGYLRDVASGGGSTKGALTCSFLRELPIPLPPTRLEQQEIADVLDAIDQKIDLHKRRMKVLEELFLSVLQKLMIGTVRINESQLSATKVPDALEVTA